MPEVRPMDPAFPMQRQLEVESSPVVLINLFLVAPEDEQTFVNAWSSDALFMKAQAGFISTKLHRAVGDSPAYLNYAVWESTARFRAAFTHPEFQAKLSAYPDQVIVSPHLFKTVSVPGICVA